MLTQLDVSFIGDIKDFSLHSKYDSTIILLSI